MSTYRKEWPCCDSVTETQGWEPDQCPFCEGEQPADELTHEQITAGAAVLGDDGKPIGRNTAIMVADAMRIEQPANERKDAELFRWIDDNDAEIRRHPNSKWTKPDGTIFYSNFTLCANGKQYEPAETFREAVSRAIAEKGEQP